MRERDGDVGTKGKTSVLGYAWIERESESKKSDCGDDRVDADLEFHVRGQVRDGSGLRRRAKVMKEVQSSSAAQQAGEHRSTGGRN